MEEISEGTISRKKSLSGDGPLALESDDMAVKASITLYQNKRQRLALKGSFNPRGARGDKTNDTVGNPNFVAVKLNSQQQAERVYFDEDTM